MTREAQLAKELVEAIALADSKDRTIEVLEKTVADLERQVAERDTRIEDLDDDARTVAEKVNELYQIT